jgi:hypothetical protein
MKRGVEYTGPALLAGMWNLLSIIDALERYSLAEIEQMARLLLESLGVSDDFKSPDPALALSRRSLLNC